MAGSGTFFLIKQSIKHLPPEGGRFLDDTVKLGKTGITVPTGTAKMEILE
jgi:hypothetical protein